MKKMLAFATAVALTSTSAYAQVGFSNGGVQLTYDSFSWDDTSDNFTDVAIGAFGIFTISPSFDIQAGINYDALEYQPGNEYADIGYELHGIYNLSSGSRVGVFYAANTMWDELDIQSFGLGYQYANGPISVELQAGATQIYDGDAGFATADVEYAYGNFTFGAGLGYVADDFFSFSKTSINAAYTIPSLYNAEIFAEYGYVSSDYDSYAGTHLEVGLKVPFGAGNKKAFGNPNNFIRDVHIYID